MKWTTAMLAGLFAAALMPALASADHRPGHRNSPGALTATATPNPVVYGRTTSIAGRLSGPSNGGKTITLRGDRYPFDGFQSLGAVVTNAQGYYSFAHFPAANTRYQARQGNQQSAVVAVLVRIRTSLGVSDRRVRRGQIVRFSGRACPQHDGSLVRIQRLSRRGWRTVRRTRLRDARRCSVYRRRTRLYRGGRYRAVVVGHADHANGISPSRRVAVR